ncbi:MAG TPA: hypothetical protein DHU65_00105 [Clostridiales bacterium]|nr:hypothetical protein [Clostridiales bacterium]
MKTIEFLLKCFIFTEDFLVSLKWYEYIIGIVEWGLLVFFYLLGEHFLGDWFGIILDIIFVLAVAIICITIEYIVKLLIKISKKSKEKKQNQQ